MTDRQLLQQALDAMRDAAYDEEGYIMNPDLAEAHDALRDRLAQCDRCGKRLGGEGDIHTCTPDPIGDAQDRLIAEIAAQKEQEPVAIDWDTKTDTPIMGYTTPPAAQPAQPEQEPVGDEWTPCMKLPVVVHVRKQRPGEAHVSTREGITPVKPDDLIMRGVSGEEYPIGRAIFEQT